MMETGRKSVQGVSITFAKDPERALATRKAVAARNRKPEIAAMIERRNRIEALEDDRALNDVVREVWDNQ